jgi:hypothetical protein
MVRNSPSARIASGARAPCALGVLKTDQGTFDIGPANGKAEFSARDWAPGIARDARGNFLGLEILMGQERLEFISECSEYHEVISHATDSIGRPFRQGNTAIQLARSQVPASQSAWN